MERFTPISTSCYINDIVKQYLYIQNVNLIFLLKILIMKNNRIYKT